MIYGFYFRFFQMTGSRMISIILSELAYFCYLLLFQVKRMRIRKRKVLISSDDAKAHIMSVYTDSGVPTEYINPVINPELDLSIVIPVYNSKDLIDSCIESVLNQKTDFSYELILVDDGSTDGTSEVLKKYENLSNVTIIHQPNKGIAGARNTGINHASGKYIMFADNDDILHDDIVEKLIRKAYEGSNDIVMCAHQLNKEKDGRILSKLPNIYPQANLYHYKNNDEIMNYAGLPWAKVYKREMWNNVRFFEGYWYEDTIIQFLLFTQCRHFAYVPEVLYEYRWYNKNFSHTQGRNTRNIKATDRYWLLKAIIKHYDEMNLPHDGQYYTLLLRHLSAFYYPSISNLEEKTIESLFVLACEIIEKNKKEKRYKLPYILRVTERSLLKRDIELWKLASRFQ